MRIFSIVTFLGMTAFLSTSHACDSTLLVEEIELGAASPDGQEKVLLTYEEGRSIVCQKNKNYKNVLNIASKRLYKQKRLLEKLENKGKLTDGQYEYYQKYHDMISDNLRICHKSLRDLQNRNLPEYEGTAVFRVKENGVSRISFYSDDQRFSHRYTSHIQWLGKILYDEGRHLCEAVVLTTY